MTEQVEKVVLLPCPNPWCEAGEREGDFRPHIHYSNFGLVYVACTSCRMAGPTRNHEAEAIAAWNTRTRPDDSVARIVALEGALRPFAEAKLQPEDFDPDLDIDGTHAALKITFGDLARARAVLGETSSAK